VETAPGKNDTPSTATSEDCGGDSLPAAQFQSTYCGEFVGQANGTAPLGSQIWINGSADLTKCIVGPIGAFVQKITFQHHIGRASNAEVNVYGAGPGMESGTLSLQFQTQTGATHTLGLTSATPQCQSITLEDLEPITSISWSTE
jgi:hypothetical protein